MMVGALFWKGGTRAGAQTGLLLGIGLWAYTLLLPLFAEAGIVNVDIIRHGPWGIDILKPQALFGLQGWGPLAHALFWSMAANIVGFVAVSLFSRQNAMERIQAVIFVDVFRRPRGEEPQVWRRSALGGIRFARATASSRKVASQAWSLR